MTTLGQLAALGLYLLLVALLYRSIKTLVYRKCDQPRLVSRVGLVLAFTLVWGLAFLALLGTRADKPPAP